MDRFAGLERKQITLCQKLIPVGQTRENIEKFRAMSMDEYVKDNGDVVRRLIRAVAAERLDGVLENVGKRLDFSEMFGLMMDAGQCDDGEARGEIMHRLFDVRVGLADKLAGCFDFKFESAATVKTLLPEYVKRKFDGDERERLLGLLNEVSSRQSVFNRFEGKVDNVFAPLLKKGTVVYRILVENARIFLNNVMKVERNGISGVMSGSDIDGDVMDVISGVCLNASVDGYGSCLRQSDIDRYNYCVGMINSEVKIFCDRTGTDYGKCALDKMYKMILSDAGPQTATGVRFETDDDVINAYNEYVTFVNTSNLVGVFDTYQKMYI